MSRAAAGGEDKGAHHVGLLVALVGPLLPAEGLVAASVEGAGGRPPAEAMRMDSAQMKPTPSSALRDTREAEERSECTMARVRSTDIADQQREDADQHGHGEKVVDRTCEMKAPSTQVGSACPPWPGRGCRRAGRLVGNAPG